MTPAFGMTDKLIDSLYLEAMVLADEAQSDFILNATGSDAILIEMQMAVEDPFTFGKPLTAAVTASQGTSNPLAAAAPSETETVAGLPEEAQGLIRESEDLYARIQRLDEKLAHAPKAANPALDLRARLERAF